MNPMIHWDPVLQPRDMARFSVGGDEGEGSSPRPKRLRLTPRFTILCSNADGRRRSPLSHGDRDQPVGSGYVDQEGEGSGDEILGSDPDHSGDVDEDDDEEEDCEEVGSLVSTNNQSRVGGQGQGQSLDGNCSTALGAGDVPNGVRPTSMDAPVSVILSDPDVFDCLICCEPLSVPVFQCENGHVACSFCCSQLHNKCPSCSMPIGYNRCRALEKVLESIKMVCQNAKYGCKELLTYGKKNEHENTCKHMPCLCPHSGCKHTASPFALAVHLSSKHLSNIYAFQYNKVFHISVPVACRSFILQGEDDRVLFIVNKKVKHLGSIVTLSCIGPHISKEGYHYVLMVKSEDGLLSLQSTTKAMQGQINYVPSTIFLLVPNDFYSAGKHIDFRIHISKHGTLRAMESM